MTNKWHLIQKKWIWLRKGNFKRETESLLIAAQNNVIRTNHIKARLDKIQQNSRCRLCGDKDKTINHIINECSKLAQKEYKKRHDWVGGQGDPLGIVQEIKVWPHMYKWYMHNQELSWRMWHTNSSAILRYKWIT